MLEIHDVNKLIIDNWVAITEHAFTIDSKDITVLLKAIFLSLGSLQDCVFRRRQMLLRCGARKCFWNFYQLSASLSGDLILTRQIIHQFRFFFRTVMRFFGLVCYVAEPGLSFLWSQCKFQNSNTFFFKIALDESINPHLHPELAEIVSIIWSPRDYAIETNRQ